MLASSMLSKHFHSQLGAEVGGLGLGYDREQKAKSMQCQLNIIKHPHHEDDDDDTALIAIQNGARHSSCAVAGTGLRAVYMHCATW